MITKFRNFLFGLFCILTLACSEGIDPFLREIYTPVEVTELTKEAWQTLSMFREGRTTLPNHDTLEERQLAFYNRYIDADGITIVGNDLTPDYYFVSARQAILIMTAKHPELRAALRDGFYFIIVGGSRGIDSQVWSDGRLRFHAGGAPGIKDTPELEHVKWVNFNGTCGLHGLAPWLKDENSPFYTAIGFCIAEVVTGLRHYSMRTVVHEFTHALDTVLRFYDPNFIVELQAAFENSIEKELWGWGPTAGTSSSHRREWFAELVEIFYFNIDPRHNISKNWAGLETIQDFIDYDPVGAELIMKWFRHAPMQVLFSADSIVQRMQQ